MDSVFEVRKLMTLVVYVRQGGVSREFPRDSRENVDRDKCNKSINIAIHQRILLVKIGCHKSYHFKVSTSTDDQMTCPTKLL